MAFNLDRKNQGSQTGNRPKAGDVVEVFITGATEFGAFGNTGNGVYLGMIHRSEIAEEMVADAREYFLVGEKVKAVVVGRRPDGKYNFSTKRLGGKARRDLSVAEKPVLEAGRRSGASLVAGGKLRDAFMLPKANPRLFLPVSAGSFSSEERQAPLPRVQVVAEELSPEVELEKLLSKNFCAPLSAAARNKLAELCRIYGPVRLTVSLMEQTGDPAVAVLSWVEEVMKRAN